MSGTELQRARETAADIMRQKQAAGKSSLNCLQFLLRSSIFFFFIPRSSFIPYLCLLWLGNSIDFPIGVIISTDSCHSGGPQGSRRSKADEGQGQEEINGAAGVCRPAEEPAASVAAILFPLHDPAAYIPHSIGSCLVKADSCFPFTLLLA